MTTAYCFDPEHVTHREIDHPEHPRRLHTVMAHLEASGRLERMTPVPVHDAPMDALVRVHGETYPVTLEGLCVRGDARLDVDTYATDTSYRVARRAVGGLLGLTDAVLEGHADNAFALVRPPGHHARPFAPMGFCLFANAAIAARHAQAVHGVDRVLIVDIDVHHGNGTQEIFYEDGSVLAFSSHQYPCYPGTGGMRETGAGAGTGATVNLPYPPGTRDEALVAAYRRLLPPLARRFRPELVIVAAGFDAHALDPLAQTNLSVRGYADLLRVALEVADAHAGGRLVATLEGGYHPDALAACVAAALDVMADPATEVEDPFPVTDRMPPGPDLGPIVDQLESLHRLA